GASEFFQALIRLRTIAVDILPYELNLPVPRFEQPPDFSDDLRRGPTSLAAPRIRNDTVSTEFVTTFYDGHERNVPGVPLGGRSVPRVPFPARAQIRHTLFAALQPFKQFRNPVRGPRPYNHPHARRALEDGRA